MAIIIFIEYTQTSYSGIFYNNGYHNYEKENE